MSGCYDQNSISRDIAERFRRFDTGKNPGFFNALVEHVVPLATDPCLAMWFEFAITTNERGRRVAELLRKYINPRGKSYLDIGCAYGGFLVAFAELGATVAGVDVDQTLLRLAARNLEDCGVDAPLICADATGGDRLPELKGNIDIITCNDVIEHVPNPLALLENVSRLLRRGGIAYFEIPNGRFTRFVMRDGHYQLFGITLLDYEHARQYFKLTRTGMYDTYSYLTIEQYRRLFRRAGLRFDLINAGEVELNVEAVMHDVAVLRDSSTELLGVPEPLRPVVAERLRDYCDEIEKRTRARRTAGQFLNDYGKSFWRVIARPIRFRRLSRVLSLNAFQRPEG